MERVRLPYGISNYQRLISCRYYYVDKTAYIEHLENLNEPYIFFLRPRRFGKSLFVSMLGYYYGFEFREKFNDLFGNYYIGKSPTPEVNSYHILKFDFSRISTDTSEKTLEGFLSNVREGINDFINHYRLCDKKEREGILSKTEPTEVLKAFFGTFKGNEPEKAIYILIDEYDHFANELIAFNFNKFKTLISGNGFVRKFYEAIKTATQEGIVDRIFATGVTPITLDSLTSGFNIASNISLEPEFNAMMGFTSDEVESLINDICKACPTCKKEKILKEMEDWYNGYLFNKEGSERVYNPDMVLYFTNGFSKNNRCKYPEEMLDTNIASDYGKVRNLIGVQERKQNIGIIEELIEKGEINSQITRQYNFERDFDSQDFISLLFYMGLITIKEGAFGILKFYIPNYVIKGLYLRYFMKILETENGIKLNTDELYTAMEEMALKANTDPYLKLIENVLKNLSNRDYIKLDEKHVKILFVAYAMFSNIYYIKSEYEVEKSYPDILFLYREPYKPPYQFIFEIKYLKKGDRGKLDVVREEAKEQMRRYLETDEIKKLENLKACVVIFVGDRTEVVESIITSRINPQSHSI